MQNHEHQLQHPSQFNERLRLQNDVETFYAESLNGPMRTPLLYDYDPIAEELYAVDGGCLGIIFDTAIEDVERKAKKHPKYAFEVRRRHAEKDEYSDMINLMDDEQFNTMIVVSDFPAELMDKPQHMGGYDTQRKQAYVRVMAKQGDKLYMYSQSLDGSDRQGLELLYGYMGFVPRPGELLSQRMQVSLDQMQQEILIDNLQSVYDTHMQQKTGVKHYAGIPIVDTTPTDTYMFVKTQTDIIDMTISMRQAGTLNNGRHYDMLALIRERFEALRYEQFIEIPLAATSTIAHIAIQYAELAEQSQKAGARAKSEGRTFSACGLSLSAEQADAKDGLESAGYGLGTEKSSEDKYGSLSFECPKGHTNTRPRNKLLDKCQKCGISVRC